MHNSVNYNKKVLGSVGGRLTRCLTLVLMAMGDPSWYEEFESKVIQFVSGKPVILTIDSAVPVARPVTWKDGSKGTILYWDVTVHEDGRTKKKELPVSSKRLNDALVVHDRKSPLQGRTFKITAIGENLQRTWIVEPV